MSVYLKKASKAAVTGQERIRNTVGEILDSIRNRGETAVREYAAKFDNWKRDFILSEEEIQRLVASVPQQAKDDIAFSYQQVHGFALKQRESLRGFETELYPGVVLGQRLVPCKCAGCYVPGGRFAHAASAIMSVATSKAAGSAILPMDQSHAPILYFFELDAARSGDNEVARARAAAAWALVRNMARRESSWFRIGYPLTFNVLY